MKSKDISIIKFLFLGTLCLFLICLGFAVTSEAYYGSYGGYYGGGYYPNYGGYGYGTYGGYYGSTYGGYYGSTYGGYYGGMYGTGGYYGGGYYGGGYGGGYGGLYGSTGYTMTPGTFPGGLQGLTIPYMSPFFQSMYPLTTTFGQGLSPSNYLGMSILSSYNSLAGQSGLYGGLYGMYGGLYGGLYGGGLYGMYGGLYGGLGGLYGLVGGFV
ncbi:MAG: hypothetical protein ACMUHX_09260 [bacterium]